MALQLSKSQFRLAISCPTKLHYAKRENGYRNRNQGNDFLQARDGARAMVDLHRLVQEGYYSKVAGGSISLKYVLPAVLHDARAAARSFSLPGIFGSSAVTSLNFCREDGHVWLQPDRGMDPYKTPPPVFRGERKSLNDMLMRLAGDDGDEAAINQGGLAMTGWNFTQFSGISADERVGIRDALLRYCELDTLAMVMLVMGPFELRGKPLQLVEAA